MHRCWSPRTLWDSRFGSRSLAILGTNGSQQSHAVMLSIRLSIYLSICVCVWVCVCVCVCAWVRVCVCVSCYNKQVVIGQLPTCEMQGAELSDATLSNEAMHQRGQHPLAMHVYLQTCSNKVFKSQRLLRSFFHDLVGVIYTLRNLLWFMATGLSQEPSMRNLGH